MKHQCTPDLSLDDEGWSIAICRHLGLAVDAEGELEAAAKLHEMIDSFLETMTRRGTAIPQENLDGTALHPMFAREEQR